MSRDPYTSDTDDVHHHPARIGPASISMLLNADRKDIDAAEMLSTTSFPMQSNSYVLGNALPPNSHPQLGSTMNKRPNAASHSSACERFTIPFVTEDIAGLARLVAAYLPLQPASTFHGVPGLASTTDSRASLPWSSASGSQKSSPNILFDESIHDYDRGKSVGAARAFLSTLKRSEGLHSASPYVLPSSQPAQYAKSTSSFALKSRISTACDMCQNRKLRCAVERGRTVSGITCILGATKEARSRPGS
jgi:hypothetical protein